VSGGPDSVSLLTVLVEMAAEFRWGISVAHVNHRLRGSESDGDESFVRALSRGLGCRFHCRRFNSAAKRKSSNLQLWARTERYRFLESTASRHGYSYIAVAHTLEDRAETVAAAVLDASGTVALSGIPPVRGRIIRPLFDVSRTQIVEFLKSERIQFRFDSSNSSDKYQRNRIRHRVLPLWSRENPAIVEGLARLGEQVWIQRQYLEAQARQIVERAILSTGKRLMLDVRKLSRYDEALDPYVLRELVGRLSIDIVPRSTTVTRFTEMRRMPKTPHQMTIEQGGLVIQRSQDRLLVLSKPKRTHQLDKVTGSVPAIQTRIVEKPTRAVSDDKLVARFDLDLVQGEIGVRWPIPGDRYQPIGLKGTKKLFDLLADRKVPAFERSLVPVVTDDGGILWPVGHPIAHRARLTGRTRRVLEARLQEGSWKNRS
jgi:tRNA(Ile)-lysidine synthase